MKILIAGGNGQIAYDLKKILTAQKINFYAPTREALQIADYDAVLEVMDTFRPDVVINAAAFTQVDRAEKDIEKAYAVNYFGAKHLAIACEATGCPLLHISTDYIFDGKTNIPYQEEDESAPLNVYGESKWRAEEFIFEHMEKFIILRVSGVFGVHGHNFVKTMLRLMQEKKSLRVVNDQITCPTPAYDIAETLITLSKNPVWGVFHYCGDKETSWYHFSKKIFEIGKKYFSLQVTDIEPISSHEYPTPAKRPAYSVLNCEKIAKICDIQRPNLEEGLHHVIKTLSTS